MKKILVANWKLYVNKESQADRLLAETKKAARKNNRVRVIVCPPTLMVPLANIKLKGTSIRVGAQNIFSTAYGAFTGEVGAHLLKDYGVEYVIVGHSERRYILDETDSVVAKKLNAAQKEGLKVILCVGEKTRTGNWRSKLLRQVLASSRGLNSRNAGDLIIAYEPVWAIGTGKADTPHDAEESISEIKKILAKKLGRSASSRIRMLYGGSVTSRNIRSFLSSRLIDGALIGRASTDPKEFGKIIRIV